MRSRENDGVSGFDDAPTNVMEDRQPDAPTTPAPRTTPEVDESSPTAEWPVVRLFEPASEAKGPQ
jgi:hypothetical protein